MIEEKQPKKENLKQEEMLVRILSQDIPGSKRVYAGLTLIKGISWSFSNAVCEKLGISREKRVGKLSGKEIEEIEKFFENLDVAEFLINRRRDLDSGKNKHLIGADLSLQKEFDIKRLKKIKAYKGVRHAFGQPVRGQRTKSHFRTERRKKGAVGVTKKKEPPKAKPKSEKGGGKK